MTKVHEGLLVLHSRADGNKQVHHPEGNEKEVFQTVRDCRLPARIACCRSGQHIGSDIIAKLGMLKVLRRLCRMIPGRSPCCQSSD